MPLVAYFPGGRSIAADKLDSPGWKMGYQLVYELEARIPAETEVLGDNLG